MEYYETYLKKIIVDNGMSYQQVAENLDLPKSCIYNYAQGYQIPKFDVGLKIARYFYIAPKDYGLLFKPYQKLD